MHTLQKKQWHAPTVLSVATMSDAEAKTFAVVESTVTVLGGTIINVGPAS